MSRAAVPVKKKTDEQPKRKGVTEKPRIGLAPVIARSSPNGTSRVGSSGLLSTETLMAVSQILPDDLSQWKSTGRLQGSERLRVERLAQVFRMAVHLFDGNIATAQRWFLSPVKGLGYQTPLHVAHSKKGAQEVSDLIGRLEDGVYW